MNESVEVGRNAPVDSNPPVALITGITGQDGSYLTELLLEQGYAVHGAVRRTSSLERSRLAHLYANKDLYNQRLFLHYADLDDPTTLRRVLTRVAPREIYHLAGQSHVGLSFEIPETTCEFTAMGTLRLLEILRDLPRQPRFFHAASSEIFGRPEESPQSEKTPMAPVSPYACAKAFATQMVRIYRDAHGLFAVNGILYNHESPRRGENFVTKKICRTAAAIKAGQESVLKLGDTNARRDWGHARDYVRGMWLALQHDQPDDYVFATGVLHSVQDILEHAFSALGLKWQEHVVIDPQFLRPSEPMFLVGDNRKAREALGWQPTVAFGELIEEMTLAELARLEARPEQSLA
ncbi:GDP-mannose 4,6-dehydratase [Thiorhodovibrio frisius]|uniref:GDP-mannose 4,6-dehydratase n=1 Tax=Thiorhodovibrio frisius TaxID=631362 RepID=H8Z634_9GAMM|nr:GDP-mannose 4,6-dehydratase [Thiorhodovibrio frisius]EIC19601.1 GDP-mannose 4,6-dehydratase [Thiorhodovibrio frisius]WPL20433.1 GDP-mannose 4,6-dehydratase [Thiorhodovibrio frisius]